MLLLFAGGVMNLAVILALTVWVAIEKLAPFGRQSARVERRRCSLGGRWCWLPGSLSGYAAAAASRLFQSKS